VSKRGVVAELLKNLKAKMTTEIDSRQAEILAIIQRSQGNSSRTSSRPFTANVTEDREFVTNGREVLKEEKIERSNDVSRSAIEEREKVATRLDGRETEIPNTDFSDPQSKSIVVSTAPILAPYDPNDRIVAVSAQQNKTDAGIKVSITIQTEADAEYGLIAPLTAELKRASKISELIAYGGDDEDFARMYSQQKRDIRGAPKELKKQLCIGRLHDRGKRSAWQADMFMVGHLASINVLDSIMFYYKDQEFCIEMNLPLSSSQATMYHCAGRFGTLVSSKQVPTLASVKRIPL
jgi:hypothetical protein